ncbi:unnamed protein product [Prunus armeniaca]|nr:hypothetical protein GBA52_020401 [Prunus armeniaca]
MEKSNMICQLIMKKSMIEAVCGGIPEYENSKEYLEAVNKKFKELQKAETGKFDEQAGNYEI